MDFKITHKDKKTKARTGILKTAHGAIHTPAFIGVATKGTLKAISFDKAKKYGGEAFIVNTYHFLHNDRYKIVKKFGGLHKYANVSAPLMTDSGGFQVFSLGFGIEHGVGKIGFFPGNKTADTHKDKASNFVKINEHGVVFRDPISGRKIDLTPESSMKIQADLGADIIFAFDECTSPMNDYEYTKQSIERTHRWAVRCLERHHKLKVKNQRSKVKNKKIKSDYKLLTTNYKLDQALFGIVQGGEWKDLRQKSAKFINSLPFPGFGIGGSMGKTKKDMYRILKWTLPLLDENKPKHLLGMGGVEEIFEGVALGIDTFDCAMPTRIARHGVAITEKGNINLRSSKYLNSKKKLDDKCKCNVCAKYSIGYLCHLVKEKEIMGAMLLTEHNLAFMYNLMEQIREAIKKGGFGKLKKKYKKLV